MSERKVLNKYFPPDFDPAKIPRLKLAKDRQYVVRLMAPCNMKCTTCSEYIYKVCQVPTGHLVKNFVLHYVILPRAI